MSDRELSRSKGRPGQREELCLEIFQVFICVRCFEIIGEYSAAACTRSYSLGSFFRAGYDHK